MAIERITKVRVERLRDGEQLWDTDVQGFGVRRRNGHASYQLKVTILGRQRFLTIGRHGSPWTAETARKEAERLRGEIAKGHDPASERARIRGEPTLGEVLDRYLEEHVAAHNRPSTQAEVRRQVEKNIKPRLGKLKLGEVTRARVKAWHATFKERKYEGNRALAYLRKALSLAHNEWELRSDNPAVGIKMFPEHKRERFYSDEELGLMGQALSSMELEGASPAGAVRVVRLLALTGMRLGEVRKLQWDWIDADAACVRLPDAKRGARTVPLGGSALAYLSSLERVGSFVCHGPDSDAPIGEVGLSTFLE